MSVGRRQTSKQRPKFLLFNPVENVMKKLIALMCLALTVSVSSPSFAGEQQSKMKGCNAEAKGMKGEERKAFMSKCLKKDYQLKAASAAVKPSASAAAPESTATPQNKMKTCNAEAKSKALAGPERKAFMSDCLKG